MGKITVESEMLIKEVEKGLIWWYPFEKDASILYIGNETDSFYEFLKEKHYSVSSVKIDALSDNLSIDERYDYIVCAKCIERVRDVPYVLSLIKSHLYSSGRLLLGVHNRLAIRYFCGDWDPYTENCLDGIEGYIHSSNHNSEQRGKVYSKSEWKDFLNKTGFEKTKFFSVFPRLSHPAMILADDYDPNEDLSNRLFPEYFHPDSVFMEEEAVYSCLEKNGILHVMANAFLIECGINSELSDVSQVSLSLDRGKRDATFTVIREGKSVDKIAAYPEGNSRLIELDRHAKELETYGVSVVRGEYSEGCYHMPYFDAPTGQKYLKDLLQKDRELFLSEMDRFHDTIQKVSDNLKPDNGDGEGIIKKRVYPDMVPLNSFYLNGKYVFFDQEFVKEDYPVNMVLWRMIATFYFGNPALHKLCPMNELLERYGLDKKRETWQSMEDAFLGELRSEVELKDYYDKIRRNPETVWKNRIRMRQSADYFDRTFMDVFKGIEGKKFYLFGSGKYADRFLDMYGDDFPVYGLLDNSAEKQGTEKRGIRIYSPDVLREADADSLKVMICMKDYDAVIKQLDDMGVKNYSVYDPKRYYATRPRTSIRVVRGESDDASGTGETVDYHCHIGYVAGAFDMFHIGHLNLLRRAKERCDYLIAGVMSDEKMYDLKKKYPVIPCNERMQVVAGCRYVDRVEELPIDRAGIRDAYHMFHFDCMFSGDDHADDPGWLSEREYLRTQGSDIVFVPYTKETSSSAIREKMKAN